MDSLGLGEYYLHSHEEGLRAKSGFRSRVQHWPAKSLWTGLVCGVSAGFLIWEKSLGITMVSPCPPLGCLGKHPGNSNTVQMSVLLCLCGSPSLRLSQPSIPRSLLPQSSCSAWGHIPTLLLTSCVTMETPRTLSVAGFFLCIPTSLIVT